ASMLANRRKAVVDLGLPSTALYTTSPTRAKQHGTICGSPVVVTVARRPTRAAAARARAGSGGAESLTGIEAGRTSARQAPFGRRTRPVSVPGVCLLVMLSRVDPD